MTDRDFRVNLVPLMAQIKLIVGLGNPGKKYRDTRHNLGFVLLDFLADQAGQKFKAGRGEYKQSRLNVGGCDVWAVKPKTFMNRSGLAVAGFCNYYGIEPEEIVVVCDDINLPPGKLRIREAGSAGGHKGLADIIRCLNSDRFARIRLGVGLPAEGQPSEDYVLKNFDSSEKTVIADMLETASRALETLICEGVTAAQNNFN